MFRRFLPIRSGERRWYVGGLATIVAGALMFSGVSPATADEAPPPDPAVTETATDPAVSDPAPAPETTDPATPAPDEQSAPADETTAPDEAAPTDDPAAPADTAETAAPDTSAQALAAPAVGPLAVASCDLVGGFEIDGNYAPGDCGGVDWTSGGYQSSAVVGTYQVVKDNSDPSTWSNGGGTPPKVDFIRNYTKAGTVGGDYFLWVGWDRQQTSGTGGYVIEVTNAGINFAPDGAPRPIRTNGGAVFYITTQGSNPPVLLQACVYANTAGYPGVCDSSPTAAGFVGAVSNEALTNPFGQPIEAGGFFEVGMNVTELTHGIISPGCPAAGVATAYMRSFTGNNFGPTGNLKGYVGPTTVQAPSTCGSLTIVKHDPSGAPLAGATFQITPNPTTGTGSTSAVTDASGTITFPGTVKPGDYTVVETVPPPGYLLPTPAQQQATIPELGSATLTFVDPLGKLTWVKQDRSGNLLGGATFSVTATSGAAVAAPWDLDANPITVVDNTGQPGYTGRDTDATPGEFSVDGLPTGTYEVKETAAPPNYVLDPTAQSATISQATPAPAIALPFMNTPYATVMLKKAWVNAFTGDSTTLTIDGANDATDTVGGTAGVSTVLVAPGTTVTVAEMLGAGNTGSYDSTLACVGATPSTGTGTSATVTVPQWPASASGVTCTFTNTAKTTDIVLHKQWVDAVAQDSITARITANGVDSNPLASIANGQAGTWLDPNSVSMTVRVGETFSITEAFNGDPAGAYSTTWSCTNGGGSGPGVTSNLAFPNGLTAPASGSSCTFTNTNGTFNLVVLKNWINGQAGDEAELWVDGYDATATSTSNGDLGEWLDAAHNLTVPVSAGAIVNAGETLDLIAGTDADYTSSVTCVDAAYYQGQTEAPAFDESMDGQEITFHMPSMPVVCEITNEAVAPTITLLKDVVVEGVTVPDTNWQLHGVMTSGFEVTNPAGGDTEKTSVHAGLSTALSETLLVPFTGSDEFEPSEWSCVSDERDIELTESVPGSATLPALNKGEDVVCTITNEHQPQGFEITKELVSSTQNEDGTWTVVYKITVENNSVLVPVEYDSLVDTLTASDSLQYEEVTWTGETSGSFDLEAGLSADLTDGEGGVVDAGGTDEYTVSAVVSVIAPPDEGTPRCDEGDGIGVINTAVVTVGEDDDQAEACGEVHYDDVSIVKTAGLPDGQTSVEPGDLFDYVLTVTNNGTRPATDVRVTDDDFFERLQITALTVSAGVTWGPAPGYSDDKVDLTIDEIGVGQSVTVTVTVLFFSPDPVVIDDDGDPTTDPILPQLIGDEPAPAPPLIVDNLENTACVDMAGDQNPENDCDSAEVPTRDITASVYTRCVNDAPFLGWTVAKSALLVGDPIDMLWTPNEATPETTPSQVSLSQPGGLTTWSDEIPWPGAAFTPSGISIDYPGWRPLQASDYAPDGGYYLPGTTTVMTPEEEAQYVFNGLILDPSELDFAWRLPTTLTFTVNPSLSFTTAYPPATPDCFVARHSNVQIEKTASVEKTAPGSSFTYSLAVANVSDDAAAEAVVVTDTIPADLKITDVSWPGEGDDSVFPNWETCAVAGQDAAGYGGMLTCELFGPLQPVGANDSPSSAPTITLSATVNPTSTASSITNVAVVDYHTFGDPDDPGRDSDDAIVLLSALPATGGELPPLLILLGLLGLLAGTATLVVTRRRRGEAKPTL